MAQIPIYIHTYTYMVYIAYIFEDLKQSQFVYIYKTSILNVKIIEVYNLILF